MPSESDANEDGWLFPDAGADETQVAPGGRRTPPVPPALSGSRALHEGVPNPGPDHFGQDAGVFGVDRGGPAPGAGPAQSGFDRLGSEQGGSGQPTPSWPQQSVWGEQDPGPSNGGILGGTASGDQQGGQGWLGQDGSQWGDDAEPAEGGWPGAYYDADDDGGRGGRGGVLIFLVGIVAVVLAALAFAALNTLGIIGGNDDDEAEVATDATTPGVTVAQPDVELGDQVFGEEVAAEGDNGAGVGQQPMTEQAPDPNALGLELIEDPFVCNSETREFARLTNAEPNEQVAFVSPQSANLRAGMADANGNVTMRWSCEPSQAPTVWEISATGATSNRSVSFAFRGVVASEAGTPGAEPGTSDPDPVTDSNQLLVAVNENPFSCDGEARPFARITGAAPNEQVRFASPESPNLRAGSADADGSLDVRWQCDAAQVGTTWNLTATGDQSGRSVTFSVTGAAG